MMRIRTVILGGLVIVVAFAVAMFVINRMWAPTIAPSKLALVPVPPLPPLTGSSTVLAPAAISMAAIRQALEAAAPRNVSGKAKNPVPKLLSDADLAFTVTRGAMSVAGRPDALVITTPLNGTLQARGVISGEANALGSAIGNLFGGKIGQQVQNLAGKSFDQHADLTGSVTTTARTTITPDWRLEPNLSAQVDIVDVALPIGGVKLSAANEIKPLLDNEVKKQTGALESRLRQDPFIENAARAEWAKLCRAIPLGAGAQGMPDLWLEIRPVRAIAAQPQIDAQAVTLLLGVQAQTRIVPNQSQPACPFPEHLDLVPQANAGTLNIAVPIDVSFSEVSRLIDAQLVGKTFPQDGSGVFAATVKHVTVAASGDRLVISILANVKKRGFFSFFGADATLNVRGRPVLDREHQIVRFTDLALDMQSQAAFGLLRAAAQAAAPYLRKTLADTAAIDLKPFAADAKERIAAAVGGFTKQGGGVSAKVAIKDLGLDGVAFDDKTLRVVAHANGSVNVMVSSLAVK
jgi:hypothetical protein